MAKGERARIRSSLYWLSAAGYRLLPNAIRLPQRDLSFLNLSFVALSLRLTPHFADC
jgi:hypothetical protein